MPAHSVQMLSTATCVACSMVCVSACVSGRWVSCAEMVELIKMPFEVILAQDPLYMIRSRSTMVRALLRLDMSDTPSMMDSSSLGARLI